MDRVWRYAAPEVLHVFRTIRAGERRDAWSAFALLFGLIASHAILETARDALFLAKIPASRLPWVYMAIAAASLVLAQAQARAAQRLSGRAALSAWVFVAALVTATFWLVLGYMGSLGLYALYVWSGVLTTLILVHFWTLLGDLFTITQAKRLYGFIGAGSVLGAICGSGLATAISRAVDPADLILVSAAGLFATSAVPGFLRPAAASSGTTENRSVRLRDNLRFVMRKRYATWVALFVIISTAGLTFADYLFKSAVAANVAPEQLGAYFATIYFALNLLSLFTQLVVIGWLLRRFDLATALSLLPFFLVLGAGVMLAMPGLIAALIIKGADGGLRYSVHRTATELLYVPFTDHGRRLVKGFIDVVGQRGGQALASVAILVLTALVGDLAVLAAMLLVVALAWLACAIRIRGHYLDLFRTRVQRDQIEHLDEFPDLDLASLESIVAALDSANDQEVLAALDSLEREGRDNLIPALTLYHPSEVVVLRALTILSRSRRRRAAHATEHLLDHENPTVRAAAVAAFSILSDDERRLHMQLSLEDSAAVRTTIRVNLIASGAIIGSDARDAIDALLRNGTNESLIAMAQAIAWREADGFEDVLVELSCFTEAGVRIAAIEAMVRLGSPAFPPHLVNLLGHEATRRAAMKALVDCGERGLEALARALDDHELAPLIRWHIPPALRGFAAEDAVPIMLEALPDEPDGMVRYRLIRALEQVQQNTPGLSLERLARSALDRTINDTVSRAYRYLDRRLVLEAGADDDPARRTPGHTLLTTGLCDKQKHAIDRLFRLLGLAYPSQPFNRMYRALDSDQARTSSLELIENILRQPLRSAVVGLVDDLPDGERLSACGPFHHKLRLSHDELLSTMLDSESDTIKSITVYHIGELGLSRFRERIAALDDDGVSRSDIAYTLERLGEFEREGDEGARTATDRDGGTREGPSVQERTGSNENGATGDPSDQPSSTGSLTTHGEQQKAGSE